jgi:hypothetical protein
VGKRFGSNGRQRAPSTAAASALRHQLPDGGDAGIDCAFLDRQVRFPAPEFFSANRFDSGCRGLSYEIIRLSAKKESGAFFK